MAKHLIAYLQKTYKIPTLIFGSFYAFSFKMNDIIFKVLATIFFYSPICVAQSIGIQTLLNPEGSRLFPQSIIFPRHPGKPDPRWIDFHWKFTDLSSNTTPYRLFYYDTEKPIAEIVIPKINLQIQKLTYRFNFSPHERFNYILFSSHREFQQANVFQISEGVQGITSTSEPTMAIPYWGDSLIFEHISTHEMTHQFQVQKFSSIAKENTASALALVPLWFIEGMAEYYSLSGIDPETKLYLNDLVTNTTHNYKANKFFEDVPLGFIHTYKLGQAKIDFLETEFAPGTAQEIFESAAKNEGLFYSSFQNLVSKKLNKTTEEIEDSWRKYLKQNYLIKPLSKFLSLGAEHQIKNAGDTIDEYDIAPNENTILTRELNIFTGITSLYLIDHNRKLEVSHDYTDNHYTLYFMQLPILALSNDKIVYFSSSLTHTNLTYLSYKHEKDGSFSLENEKNFSLATYHILEASEPEIKKDAILFLGLDTNGHKNHYIFDLHSETVSLLTDQLYKSHKKTQQSTVTLKTKDNQIDLYHTQSQKKIFSTYTKIILPKIRNQKLYFLGFYQGRYHLYHKDIPTLITESAIKNQSITRQNTSSHSLKPDTLYELNENNVKTYQPFKSSGTRTDYVLGYLTSGSAAAITGQFSDLMRNYIINAEFGYFSSLKNTNTSLFLSNQQGRTLWTIGAYHLSQPRLDNRTSSNFIQTYVHREFGLIGSLQYPFSPFLFIESGLRLSGAIPGYGLEFMTTPIFRLGYDRILYETFSGPLQGPGLLLESETSIFPRRMDLNERIRLDLSYYIQATGRTVLAFQSICGATFGGLLRNPFLLSSDDILRAYSFGDSRLNGNYLLAVKSEFRFPIGTIFGFPPLRGLLSADYGSIFREFNKAYSGVTASSSAGLSLNLPPISLNFLLSYPIIKQSGNNIENDSGPPVLHFILRYLYL